MVLSCPQGIDMDAKGHIIVDEVCLHIDTVIDVCFE